MGAAGDGHGGHGHARGWAEVPIAGLNDEYDSRHQRVMRPPAQNVIRQLTLAVSNLAANIGAVPGAAPLVFLQAVRKPYDRFNPSHIGRLVEKRRLAMQQRDDNVLTTNDAIRAMAATVGRLMMQAKTSAEHDAEVETLLESRRRRGDTLRAAQRTFPDWTRFTGRFTGAVELYAIDLELYIIDALDGNTAAPLDTAVDPLGTAVTLLGTAVAPLGDAVAPLGAAVDPHGTAVTLLGTAVAPLGAAVASLGDAVAPLDIAVDPLSTAVPPLEPPFGPPPPEPPPPAPPPPEPPPPEPPPPEPMPVAPLDIVERCF